MRVIKRENYEISIPLSFLN